MSFEKKSIECIEEKAPAFMIPSKKNCKIQRLYDAHLIACFFGKIKRFRQIFASFDKVANTFLAFLSCVKALIWLY